MDKINFGIDGWWGIIAKDFTLSNVSKVAYAVSRWLTNKFRESAVVLGYDTRFGGEMFMEAVAKILASKNIQVYISESFVTSPMVSFGVVKLKAQCGLVITASHNPGNYNGIKLKGAHGGPLLKSDFDDIQALIDTDYDFDLEMLNWNYLLEQGKIQYINLESIYIKNIIDNFDVESIREKSSKYAFDSMYGASQRVMLKLFPDAKHFHAVFNPGFDNVPPDPIYRNLHELADYLHNNKGFESAFAVDADGDRLAFFDENGNYVNSHEIFLLVIHIMVKYLGQSEGKVIAGYPLTSKVEKLCSHHGIDVKRTKVGFGSIASDMLKEDVMVGGQETGGIAIGTYLPERDAIWMGIQIWSWLNQTGRKIGELVAEVKEITGSFAFDKTDLHFNRNERKKILDKCRNNEFTEFGTNLVTKVEHLDGTKFFFGEDEWIMVRPSSIHPLLRLYAEAADEHRVQELMQSVIEKFNEN